MGGVSGPRQIFTSRPRLADRSSTMSEFTDTQRRAARENPLDLIALAHPEYTFAPVHDLYAEVIVNAVFAATHPKLAMPRRYLYIGPPRHSKSGPLTVGGRTRGPASVPTLTTTWCGWQVDAAVT